MPILTFPVLLTIMLPLVLIDALADIFLFSGKTRIKAAYIILTESSVFNFLIFPSCSFFCGLTDSKYIR